MHQDNDLIGLNMGIARRSGLWTIYLLHADLVDIFYKDSTLSRLCLLSFS